jgi:hypothetical protein
MSSILCGLFFGMAGLVAVTIEKNHRIVKTSLFARYFGITFTAFTFSATGCSLLASGIWPNQR